MFAPAFLAQVPASRMQAITDEIVHMIGPVVDISQSGEDYIVASASHTMSLVLVLDGSGRVAGLLMQPAVQTNLSIDEILAEMRALEGAVSYLVTEGGATLRRHNSEEKLAVGSAFKIAILAVLAEKIARGEASWDSVLRLGGHQVSLPSGTLQKLAIGSPLTVHTLAAMMISISDNTGTDMLLDFVGRAAVAAKLDVDFVLKTRELFLLKSNANLRAKFLNGALDQRYALALEMDGMALPLPRDASGQHVQGIEYYVSLNRLCTLIGEVAELDVMQINPGVADKNDWGKITFKGGGEQGVLNFTTQVTGSDGIARCIAFSWNADGSLDSARATKLYAALIKALAD